MVYQISIKLVAKKKAVDSAVLQFLVAELFPGIHSVAAALLAVFQEEHMQLIKLENLKLLLMKLVYTS